MAEQLKLELIKFHMRSGVYRDTHLKVLSESLEKIITVGQVAELKMIDSATDTKQ